MPAVARAEANRQKSLQYFQLQKLALLTAYSQTLKIELTNKLVNKSFINCLFDLLFTVQPSSSNQIPWRC